MEKPKFIPLVFVFLLLVAQSCHEEPEPPHGMSVSEDIHLSSGKNTPKNNPPVVNKLLADVRKATTMYHDVNKAEASGYVNTIDCVSDPAGSGGMGVHFVNFGLIDDVFDPEEPEVLLYEIRNNGSYKLTGVEYLYVGENAPLFAGIEPFKPFDLPFADFALHVWVWKGNPNGIFEDYNVNVICDPAGE